MATDQPPVRIEGRPDGAVIINSPTLAEVKGKGLPVLGALARKLTKRGRTDLGDAEAHFPRMPLRLGEPMLVRFTQQCAEATRPVQDITATLVCEEWARLEVEGQDEDDPGGYRPDSVQEKTHEAWSARLPARDGSEPGGAVGIPRGSWVMELPPELPASFWGDNNGIRWLLRIRAEIDGGPTVTNTFTLPVIPEVARDLR